jgi:hypothetical protein
MQRLVSTAAASGARAFPCTVVVGIDPYRSAPAPPQTVMKIVTTL